MSDDRGATASAVRREGAAEIVRPLLTALFGEQVPLLFEFWDGSTAGEASAGGRVIVRSPDALKQLLWAPGELGIARAFVLGTLDLSDDGVDGPATPGGEDDGLVQVLRSLLDAISNRLPTSRTMIRPLLEAAWKLHLYSVPPRVPSSEVRLTGRWRPASIHTRERDAEAIRHHYDIGNEFYELVLGPAMTYSCARFETPEATLEQAQASKHELVCRKLGLADEGRFVGRAPRLLDVGCGWGSMAIHAAQHHGADVVGVTLSPAQAALAKKRIADAGLTDRIDIRIEDYRDLSGETFDAISSIGMFEHVGESRMAEYFDTLAALLAPEGRLLNHAISSVGSSKMRGRTFMNRYVFPDGELIDVADVAGGMERAGFEVRDVESLREHYARTLRCWVANLESNWDEAVSLVGLERARVWRLYMSASVNGFDDGGIAIHQVLGIRPRSDGTSGMPLTRASWG